MTRILTRIMLNMPKYLLTAALYALVIIGIGGTPFSAKAEDRHDDRRGDEHRGNRDHREVHGRGYYNPPPVVYGSPCGWGGCAPPVVYGPGIGIVLPNVILNLH